MHATSTTRPSRPRVAMNGRRSCATTSAGFPVARPPPQCTSASATHRTRSPRSRATFRPPPSSSAPRRTGGSTRSSRASGQRVCCSRRTAPCSRSHRAGHLCRVPWSRRWISRRRASEPRRQRSCSSLMAGCSCSRTCCPSAWRPRRLPVLRRSIPRRTRGSCSTSFATTSTRSSPRTGRSRRCSSPVTRGMRCSTRSTGSGRR